MTTLLTLLAIAAPQPAIVADYKPHNKGCNTRACDRRVDRKLRRRRAHRYNRLRRRVIRPYLGWLRSTRACESPTGRDSANGMYHGYYQFDVQSWRGAGGWGMPCQASWLEQSYRAVIWLKKAGRGAWPVCG
jgi:hypothetical protein